ncbi:unnamed protein product [Leuciscus chuanchicus]
MSFLLDPGRKHPAQQPHTNRGRPSLSNSSLPAKLGQALKSSSLIPTNSLKRTRTRADIHKSHTRPQLPHALTEDEHAQNASPDVSLHDRLLSDMQRSNSSSSHLCNLLVPASDRLQAKSSGHAPDLS